MDKPGISQVDGGWWMVDGENRRPSPLFRFPTSDLRPLTSCLPHSIFRPPTSDLRSPASAFTLIELLTAMSILVIIVMIALRIFLQSSTVWNVSSTRARINMLGRAAVDYVSQEQAVTNHPGNLPKDEYTRDVGISGVPACTPEFSGTNPVSVAVKLDLTVSDPQRARGAVRAWSGGPDKALNTPDDINSWN